MEENERKRKPASTNRDKTSAEAVNAITPSGNTRSSKIQKNSSTFKTITTKTKKKTYTALQCHDCKLEYEIAELKMDQTTYLLLQSMEERGSRWHCQECLNETKPATPGSPTYVEKQIKKLSEQISCITNQMKVLTESHHNLEENTVKITNAAESFSKADNRSWAEIASTENPSVDMITNLTKQVLKDQKNTLC